MDISKIINDIKNDMLSLDELINCLDIPQKFIISNTIIKILKLGIKDTRITEKLKKIAGYRSNEHEFIDSVTIGHLATAALFIMDDLGKESYYQLYNAYSNYDREKTEYALEILNDLVHS